MNLSSIRVPESQKKKKKRKGRGNASGQGGTSGRGHKGQRARSGFSRRFGYEGGQMPLQRRVPKRGFTNLFKKKYNVINLAVIETKYQKGETVDYQSLKDKKIIKHKYDGIKVLAKGELSKSLNFNVDKLSNNAIEKIFQAGGKIEGIEKPAKPKKQENEKIRR